MKGGPGNARRRMALAVALGASLAGSRAAAQSATGFALDRFEPASPGSDWFGHDSLDLRGHLGVAAGIVGDFAYRPLVLYNPDGSVGASIVRDQDVLHAGATVVLWNRARFGLNLPVAIYQVGLAEPVRGVAYFPPHGASLGDLRLEGDARLYGEPGQPFTLAAGALLYLPTGSREQYLSDGTVRFTPRVQAAGGLGPFVYAARVGVAVRPHDATFENTGLGTELVFGGAVGIRLWAKRLVVGPELSGSTVLGSHPGSFAVNNTPVELLVGAHARVFGDFVVGAGIAPGLARGLGEPLVRALASVAWVPRTRPAVPDEILLPPPAPPEPAPPAPDDGPVQPQLAPGSPSAGDRDHDGVPDATDACPDEPGPPSPDPDKDGCPDAFVRKGRIHLRTAIKFLENSAELDPSATPTLDAVQHVLATHPAIVHLRIEGHTDDQGSFANNLLVSKKRAKTVSDWLAAHGVAPTRLESQGYGSAMPIADNATPEGREQNRRIELVLIENDR